MYGMIRRWEGTDTSRIDEVARAIQDEFVPMIRGLDGYHGYWVVQSDSTVVTFGLYESREDAERTTQMAKDFLRDHDMESAMPNPPQVTAGEVKVAGPVHALA